MQTPPEISFRNVEATPELKAAIKGRIEDMEKLYDLLIGCHVMVESRHRRRQTGNPVQVRIEVTLPGRRLVVNRDPSDEPWHADPFLAVGDAFDDLRRRLKEHVRGVRGEVKTHAAPLQGRISELIPDGHGFIQDSDGTIVYFHENSVRDLDFADLVVGDQVRYSRGYGDEGPQATSVRRFGSAPVTTSG